MTDARAILFKSNPWVRPWVGFEPMISELHGKRPNHLASDLLVVMELPILLTFFNYSTEQETNVLTTYLFTTALKSMENL